ncbi:MAG: hypothetical protein ACNI3C_02110 [Candidatus Marinarcus sp.]|uniref:hypothetical protein n=1 Tax=Candidatus Marinarcus sp. TaxID=3100987 RepID=UPI003AFFEFF6
MSSEQLDSFYHKNKKVFHNYINNIKQNSQWDIYSIINETLIKNPYTSVFVLNFFRNNTQPKNKFVVFLKSCIKLYIKSFYLIFSYFIAYILFKIYYKKQRKNKLNIIIDVFGLVDKVNKEEQFNENYLADVYEIFEKNAIQYAILLRPYQVGKNPFKLKKFFKIINEDKRDFILEYELLKLNDFIRLFGYFLIYPFKTLRLLQNENENTDISFNYSLIIDIQNVNFESFTRHILGEKLANISSLKKIYSWSEFQVIERSFNYSIRKNSDTIELIGLQFFLNYETYFNTYVDDLDYEMLSSPHKILVNGKYYLQNREKVRYDIGVSLRYKDIFLFKCIKEEKNILLLGSYIATDTMHMLKSIEAFENVIFKNHPVVDIRKLGKLSKNITVTNENIYKLFENTKLVIATASGTGVEAVSCGISVIIIASNDNLTANPLIEYGKGKIWDIAFSKDDVGILYNKLIEYRKNNIEDIKKISMWYKENFFIQPTKENIINAFDLNKE